MERALQCRTSGWPVFCALALLVALTLTWPSPESQTTGPIQAAPGDATLRFETNVGQTDRRARFIVRAAGYNAYLNGPASVTFTTRESRDSGDVSMSLVGADASAAEVAEQPAGVSNYYIGNDRSKWREGIPNYSAVRYRDLYPGIDLIYQGDHHRLRHDFVVRAGADPAAIRLAYAGGNPEIGANGELRIGPGGFSQTRPAIFQEYDGERHAVTGGYELAGGYQVRFHIGPYDRSHDLVIDPTNTSGVYVGGTNSAGNTAITGVAQDSSGVYVTGTTTDPSFAGNFFGTPGVAGVPYAFVNKYSPDLSSMIYSTAFGGNNGTAANGIAVGLNNTAVVVGNTESGNGPTGFPTLNPVETGSPSNPTAQHAFVAGLSATGALTLSSLLFGSGTETANGVAVEGAGGAFPGRIHLAGATTSTDLLSGLGTVSGPPSYQSANNSATGGSNAFYLVLAPNSAIVYDTYLGGYGNDAANAIAVDQNGNADVGGTTNSFGAGQVIGVTGLGSGGAGCTPDVSANIADPPTGKTAFLNTLVIGGSIRSLVIVDPGSGYTPGSFPGIAIGRSGGSCTTSLRGLGGVTLSQAVTGGSTNNFPRTAGAAIPVNPLGAAPLSHGFIAQFNPNAATSSASLSYSIYLGGIGGNPTAPTYTETETVKGVAVDNNGNVDVTGETTNTAQVNGSPVFQAPGGGGIVGNITITRAGSGYPLSATSPITFGSGCVTNPTAMVQTSGTGEINNVVLQTPGAGCDHSPTATLTGFGSPGLPVTLSVNLVAPIQGVPTAGPGARDGFALELANPLNGSQAGNAVNSLNGITLNAYPSFPSLIFATLITGDMIAGNNTGAPAPAGTQVTMGGIDVDGLGHASVTGSATNTAGGPSPGNPVIIFRRVHTNGTPASNTPFFVNSSAPTQSVNRLGDILLGAGTNGVGAGIAVLGGVAVFGGAVSQPLPDSTIIPGPFKGNSGDGILFERGYIDNVALNPAAISMLTGTLPALSNGDPNPAFPANPSIQFTGGQQSTPPLVGNVTFFPQSNPWLIAGPASANNIPINLLTPGSGCAPLTSSCIPTISTLSPGEYDVQVGVIPTSSDSAGDLAYEEITDKVTGRVTALEGPVAGIIAAFSKNGKFVATGRGQTVDANGNLNLNLTLQSGTGSLESNGYIAFTALNKNLGAATLNLAPTQNLPPGDVGCFQNGTQALITSAGCDIQATLQASMATNPPSSPLTFTLGVAPGTVGPFGAPQPPELISGFPLTLTIAVVTGGPLIAVSPWATNLAPFVTSAGGTSSPAAPFVLPPGFVGNITSIGPGNNPDVSSFMLDTINLDTTSPGTFTATVSDGISVAAASGFARAPIMPGGPTPPGCTASSPGLPPGVLHYPATGSLPASNAAQTTVSFPISITIASALPDGSYANTINVIPNGIPAQAASIPVCVQVGNQIGVAFAQTQPTFAYPPVFAGGVPVSTFTTSEFTAQEIQAAAWAFGAPPTVDGSGSFGPSVPIAVPIAIFPDPNNPAWVTAAPQGNEFPFGGQPSVTAGGTTIGNCSPTLGSDLSNPTPFLGTDPTQNTTQSCLTGASRGVLVAPTTGTPLGANSLAFDVVGTPPSGNGPFGISQGATACTMGSPCMITLPFTVSPTYNPCDVTGAGSVGADSLAEILKEVLGLAPPNHDLNHDGTVNVGDAQTVDVNATGGRCK